MAAPGLVVLAPVYMFLGAMFVSVDLSTVDFAQRSGHKPLAGLILGVYAFGSATGGSSTLNQVLTSTQSQTLSSMKQQGFSVKS